MRACKKCGGQSDGGKWSGTSDHGQGSGAFEITCTGCGYSIPPTGNANRAIRIWNEINSDGGSRPTCDDRGGCGEYGCCR